MQAGPYLTCWTHRMSQPDTHVAYTQKRPLSLLQGCIIEKPHMTPSEPHTHLDVLFLLGALVSGCH